MKTVALLLEDEENRYQKLLSREAKSSAGRYGVVVLEPEFAAGSSWTQIESVNAHLRQDAPPDAMMIVPAGEQYTRPVFERVAKKGMALIFLNRIPEWASDLREQSPDTLVAGIGPHQVGIGQMQARQALRLSLPGASVALVTGAAASVTAVERTRGFLETVRDRLSVHSIDGRWTALGAQKALSEWFHLGSARNRSIGLVVCQNDSMAGGIRTALTAQAGESGHSELERIPIIGCDGLEDEGQAMVTRGELAATVVMPPTTPSALETLQRYWNEGERPERVLLDARSFPPVEKLSRRE